MLAHEFVVKWSKANLKERSAAQEHFIDLCRLLEHPTPVEADAEGSHFTFEKGAKKSAGGDGFADVWKRGFFAWEYKGKHASLNAAYQQLLQYREDLENPPLLVVCDLDRFEVHTNFTNTITQVHRFSTNALNAPTTLDLLRKVFFEPDALRPGQTSTGLTEEAAGQFARLADMLRNRGIEAHQAAHFLTKVIFCLFAEDVGLLPRRHFARIAERTANRPQEFVRYTQELFQAMSAGGTSLLEDIPYFNGNLFSDAEVLELTPEELVVVRDAGRFDWSQVEPAIFGTLFERSLDPSKRSQIGAHYTHPDDIRAIVEPVLMAPLRREWEEVRQKVGALAERIASGRSRNASQQRQQMRRLLLGFLDQLSAVRVLDPACGSGNFLYISMNLLKDLEKEVITFAGSTGLTLPLYQVTPGQLLGLEINPYARELAQTAIWIGYIQWHQKNGFPVQQNPVLQALDTIQSVDAILDLSDKANPKEPEWPSADVIVGNPPFLGGGRLRQGLGDKYVDALFDLYGERLPNFSDLCCYWFEKARAMVADGKVKRVGLLATQGVRGGANRRVLERIKETGDIFLAYSDRPWVLDGAAVHVSIVCFDDGSEQNRGLDGQRVSSINANLTAGADLTHARRLTENIGICFMGPSAKAPFDINWDVADVMISAPPNPNGRLNSEVVRSVASAIDLVQRLRGKWTIDFGTMSAEEAALYELPFEYVRRNVYPVRLTRRDDYRGQWWQYARPRPEMREALKGKSRFIATPGVSKYRVFVWVAAGTICNQGTLVFARDDDYTFGVLHSRVHEVWALALGTQLETRPRYTPTTTFETFPFPRPTGGQREAIAAAAQELDRLRKGWLNPPGALEAELRTRTLTNLYNARPTWLANVHEKLDCTVLDAYGWLHSLSDQELLERLLALNLQREPV